MQLFNIISIIISLLTFCESEDFVIITNRNVHNYFDLENGMWIDVYTQLDINKRKYLCAEVLDSQIVVTGYKGEESTVSSYSRHLEGMALFELIPIEKDAPETASVLNIHLLFLYTPVYATSLSCRFGNSVVYLANHTSYKGHFLFGRNKIYETPKLVAFFTLYLPSTDLSKGDEIFQRMIKIKKKKSLDQITEVEKAFFSDGGIRNYLICASVFRKIVQAVSYAKKYFLEISHTKIKIDLETETKELFEVSVIQCIAKDLETHYVRDEQFMFFIIPYPKDSEKVFTCFPDTEKEYTLSILFLEVGNYEE